jgi:hypothetical protein
MQRMNHTNKKSPIFFPIRLFVHKKTNHKKSSLLIEGKFVEQFAWPSLLTPVQTRSVKGSNTLLSLAFILNSSKRRMLSANRSEVQLIEREIILTGSVRFSTFSCISITSQSRSPSAFKKFTGLTILLQKSAASLRLLALPG